MSPFIHSASKKIPLTLAVASIFFIAPFAHAATISFIAPANTIPTGAPFQIEVHLETNGDSVNTVSGGIDIPDGIRVTSVETGDSLLQLWPMSPTYIPSKKQILFTGGEPGGIAPQTDGLLFKITVIALTDGTYQFETNSVTAYANDGEGTELALAPSTVSVQASGTAKPSRQVSVSATPSPDITPPVFTYVAVGKDPSLFNDAYFVTFYASDGESGIDHYEVKEGWFGSSVHANQYYVLQDQTLSTPIIIRAVDRAGNIATYIVPAAHSSFWIWGALTLAAVLVVLVVLFYIRRKGVRAA